MVGSKRVPKQCTDLVYAEVASTAATQARAAVDSASNGGGSAPDGDKEADRKATEAAAFAAATSTAANAGPCDPMVRRQQAGMTSGGNSDGSASSG